MRDTDNFDGQYFIFDGVYDAIIANAQSPAVFASLKFFTARGSRVIFK